MPLSSTMRGFVIRTTFVFFFSPMMFFSSHISIGAVGLEYQLESSIFGGGTSIFAEGRIGEDDYAAVWGGVRLYLGQEKSLIRRHREDDPGEKGPDNLRGVKIDDPEVCNPEFTFCGSPT